MSRRSIRTRKLVNGVVTAIAGSAAAVGLIVLLCILYSVAERGIPAINWAFFTQMPRPAGGHRRGLANAIIGSILITACAVLMGIPLGLLAEHISRSSARRGGWRSHQVRGGHTDGRALDSDRGIRLHAARSAAGSLFGLRGIGGAGDNQLPLVTRVTEDMLKMVPNTFRESALALGAPEYKMVFQVIFRSVSGCLRG